MSCPYKCILCFQDFNDPYTYTCHLRYRHCYLTYFDIFEGCVLLLKTLATGVWDDLSGRNCHLLLYVPLKRMASPWLHPDIRRPITMHDVDKFVADFYESTDPLP